MGKTRPIKDIKSDLEEAKAKFLDVVKRGDAAISKYDIMMGYDADFYLNRCPILPGHIIYYRKELKEATKHGVQQELL